MFTRPQRIRTEVGARAIRLATLFAAQRQSIRFPRSGAGQDVIGPSLFRVRRLQAKLLLLSPFRPFSDGPFDKLPFAQVFERDVEDGSCG